MLRDKLYRDIKQGLYNIEVNLKIPDNIDAYNKTKKWIKEEKKYQDLIKITEENQTNYIYIDYGNRIIDNANMIRILFSFNNEKNMITVKLISVFGSFWDDKFLIKEKGIIQDYFEYIVGSQDNESIKQIYTKDDVKHILKWIIYKSITYLVFISIFLFVIMYVSSSNVNVRTLLLGIFSSMFLVGLILGPVRDYIKYKKMLSIL
jgi:hypothetical protein